MDILTYTFLNGVIQFDMIDYKESKWDTAMFGAWPRKLGIAAL